MGRKTIVIGEEEEEESQNQTGPIYNEHPLFPLEPNEKSFDVSFIQITRWEEGKQKWGPCVRGEDLLSEDALFERFGGGDYILVARSASKLQGLPGRTSKHRRLNLAGLPKPISSDPTPTEARLANPTAPVPGQQPPVATSPIGHDPMAFLTLMLEKERIASEKAQQQQNQFMQMFLAIMTGSKSDSQNMMQLVMQMNQQSQAAMLQFMTAMMSNRGGGPEEMAKYAELLKALGVGGSQPAKTEGTGGIAGMLENAADVIQGLALLKGVGGNGQNGAHAALQPTPTELPSRTGGASALLRGMRGG